jgi:hypothetical protein
MNRKIINEDIQWKTCVVQVGGGGSVTCGEGSAKVVWAKNARIVATKRAEDLISIV